MSTPRRPLDGAVRRCTQANIRVWMLTGDKRETAINIGSSCSLLHDDLEVLQCLASSEADIQQWATSQLAKFADTDTPLALVIDGKTLTLITSQEYDAATRATAVSRPGGSSCQRRFR